MLCLFYFRNTVHRIPSLKMVLLCYTDVCNVMAINVQCYLMPNKIYVILCYVMYADTDKKHTLVQTETKAITVYCTWLKTSIEHH